MGITLWQHYLNVASRIADEAFDGIETLEDWQARRAEIRGQFLRSIGMDRPPEKCDLTVQTAGDFAGEGYHGLRLAWQILPDCWATGCLYLPDPLPDSPCPGVLYVAGHASIGSNGYQDHCIMAARRGYVCLAFDTIEQHDNPGEHHGLYYDQRPDWVSMGYSGATGELWNSVRALDVLASRPEVDADRIGATGNSGGGAHSFFLTVYDERIKALATSCGVTVPNYTLANRHLMGHCDCMYLHNVYGLDTSEFAALIAPRPALYCFASEDLLFSNQEYHGLVERARKIYALYDCENNCQLCEYPGPHGYQPESVTAINDWFDNHVACARHPQLPRQPKEQHEKATAVFNGKPPSPDHLNLLPELLTAEGGVHLPQTPDEWPAIQKQAREALRSEVFHLLDDTPLEAEELGSWLSGENPHWRYCGVLDGMDVWIEAHGLARGSDKVVVAVCSRDELATDLIRRVADQVDDVHIVVIEPRGTGLTGVSETQRNHLLRAGAITGKTPVMLMVEDIQRMLPCLRTLPAVEERDLYLYGRGDAGVACLYAAALDETIAGVACEDLPASHHRGGQILGVLRVLDIPQTVGLVAPRPVALAHRTLRTNFHWPVRLYDRLGCSEKLIQTQHSLRAAMTAMLNPA